VIAAPSPRAPPVTSTHCSDRSICFPVVDEIAMLVLSPDSGFVLAPCDGAYIANEFKKELVVDSRGSWNAVRAASFI
jgi:hypothetical protein